MEFAVRSQQARILAVYLFAAAWSLPAFAEGVSATSSQASSDVSLSLDVSGHIAPRCVMTMDSARMDVVMSHRKGSASLGASVDCNDAMRVDFTSRNGALIHTGADVLMDSPGFTSRVPYDVTLDVAAPGAVPVTVASEDAGVAATGGGIGVVPFDSRAQLRVDWRAEEEPFGGTYGDVIEIRVSIAGDTGGLVP